METERTAHDGLRVAQRDALLAACLELVELDLVARTWGNLSVRAGSGSFLITPSGIPYEDLGRDDLVEVGLEGLSWTGSRKPSSEKELHALIYRLRPGTGAIVHTHQFWASAVAAARSDIPGEGDLRVPCAPYALPTTRPLARAVAKTAERFPEAQAILLANHGAVCLGASLEEAVSRASALERRARAFVLERFAIGEGRNQASVDDLLARFVDLKGRVTA